MAIFPLAALVNSNRFPAAQLLSQESHSDSDRFMWTMFVGFFGGLGLFFAGLKLTGEQLRNIAGRAMREAFAKFTRNPLNAIFFGFISGLFIQSSSGISLVLSSLIGARVTTVERCLPMLMGANLGVACLVLIAVLDVKGLALVLLGVCGLIITFERPFKLLRAAWIFFGVSLVLFGLQTVRYSLAPLSNLDSLENFLTQQDLQYLWHFVAGAAASLAMQTTAGVSILTVTLAGSGLMDLGSSLAIIYGSLMGSSLLTYIFSLRVKGARKRLIMGQVFFNVSGLCLFLPLFVVENYFDLPLLQTLTERCITDLPGQLVALRIFFDVLTAFILLLGLPWYRKILEKLYPDDESQLGGLAYIKEITELSPETAMVMVNKEQCRLIAHLPDYTAILRREAKEPRPELRQTANAIELLLSEINQCLRDLASRAQTDEQAGATVILNDAQNMLKTANDTLNELCLEILAAQKLERIANLAVDFREGLDAFLLAASDTFGSLEPETWAVFMEISKDKSPVMERLRAKYFSSGLDFSPKERQGVMHLSMLFERTVWLLRRLGILQQRFLVESGTFRPASDLDAEAGQPESEPV